MLCWKQATRNFWCKGGEISLHEALIRASTLREVKERIYDLPVNSPQGLGKLNNIQEMSSLMGAALMHHRWAYSPTFVHSIC